MGPDAQSVFRRLFVLFTKAPILRHPDAERPYIVETDASNTALSAALSQHDPKTQAFHPVAYYSQKLTPPEINYNFYEKKILAIMEAFAHWRHYLQGPNTRSQCGPTSKI